MRIITTAIIIGIIGAIVLITMGLVSPLKTYKNNKQIKKEVSKVTQIMENFQKLDSKYCVRYGSPKAPTKIVEFFSFQCPHCVKLFNDDFAHIRDDFIETGKVCFEFHPIPQDLSTVQALICFEKLGDNEKRLFMEVLLEEAIPSDPDLMCTLMMTAMTVFQKPLERLNDEAFLKSHPIMEEVYCFLKQDNIVRGVPSVEINGRLFDNDVPNYQFISSMIKD